MKTFNKYLKDHYDLVAGYVYDKSYGEWIYSLSNKDLDIFERYYLEFVRLYNVNIINEIKTERSKREMFAI